MTKANNDGRKGHARKRKLAARDGMVCWLCDKTMASLAKVHCSVDHFTPRSLGGSDAMANLRLTHPLCNKVRGNILGVDEARARVAAYHALAPTRSAKRKKRRAMGQVHRLTFEQKLAAQKQDEDADVFATERYAG